MAQTRKLIPRQLNTQDICVIQYMDNDRRVLKTFNDSGIIYYLNAYLAEDNYIKHYWFMSENELALYDPFLMSIPDPEYEDMNSNIL